MMDLEIRKGESLPVQQDQLRATIRIFDKVAQLQREAETAVRIEVETQSSCVAIDVLGNVLSMKKIR